MPGDEELTLTAVRWALENGSRLAPHERDEFLAAIDAEEKRREVYRLLNRNRERGIE